MIALILVQVFCVVVALFTRDMRTCAVDAGLFAASLAVWGLAEWVDSNW